jgi:putative NADPH-quinone reductase
MLRVNLYYGGRGLIEDPSLFVMDRMIQVLHELNVDAKKYNLYEDRHGISVLPKTLKDADAVILVASVEWLGIGGLLTQFLDACWLYGDSEKMQQLYMMPVVLSTTIGEKDAQFTLVKAWEMLGGLPCEGVCAYVRDRTEFETNPEYSLLIEKAAENFYRTFSKKQNIFPTSTNAVCETILPPKSIHLTPQESEQLASYVSDDNYVKKQKADIEELAQKFRGMLGDEVEQERFDPLINALKSHFHPMTDVKLCFSIEIQDRNKTLILKIHDDDLECFYGEETQADAFVKTTQAILEKLISGRSTLQGAFLAGDITLRGDFKIFRTFDSLFQF